MKTSNWMVVVNKGPGCTDDVTVEATDRADALERGRIALKAPVGSDLQCFKRICTPPSGRIVFRTDDRDMLPASDYFQKLDLNTWLGRAA